MRTYIVHNKYLKLHVTVLDVSYDSWFNDLNILSGLVQQLLGLSDLFCRP